MYSTALMPTPFIGRADELESIGTLLDDPSCRLLTLVGAGGIGKTRLALEVAERRCDSFPDGVYFAALAPLVSAEDILTAITEATPYRFQKDGRNARAQFLDYLAEKSGKRILIIIDNFEHVLDGVEIVSDMLAATENLKILVTSREALNLQEEWVRHISGLAFPDTDECEPLETYGAVQLFTDRARRIRGDFDLNEDSQSVVEICRLTEGMPLAIELAVGWLKTLQPADIAREIRRGMDILATRSRNLPERHRSIRSVFDHSWRLMSAEERAVFQRLSIFRGGFTRTAAETVAGASLHVLAGLVDKSLVRLNATGRYDIHEMLRQYGSEQLDGAGQTAPVQRVYIAHYLGMLARLEPDIKSHRQIEAHDQIAADFENMRHAWLLAMAEGDYPALNLAVESLHFFADMRGRYHEVATLFTAALDQATEHAITQDDYMISRIRSRLARLILLGTILIRGDTRAQLDASLATARAQHDDAEAAFCLMTLANLTLWEIITNFDVMKPIALAQLQESHDIYTRLGDRFYIAETLAWIASITSDDGDQETGTEILERSSAIRREIGDRNGIAWNTLNLMEYALMQMNYAESERYGWQALALMREIGSLKGILQTLFKLASLNLQRGDFERFGELIDELVNLAEETNNLDAKMGSLGLLSLRTSLIHEDYAEGLALAEKSLAFSLQPYFRAHTEGAAHWGCAIALCGLGQYSDMRPMYMALQLDAIDDRGLITTCFALEAVAQAHEFAYETAAEMLGIATGKSDYANGWLSRWPLITRLRDTLTAHLGASAYEQAFARGTQQDGVAALETLLGIRSAEPAPRGSNHTLIEPLSRRELEILELIAGGLSNRDIAEKLVLSVGTVKVHTRNIYGKLNVNSRTQALVQAAKYHLL